MENADLTEMNQEEAGEENKSPSKENNDIVIVFENFSKPQSSDTEIKPETNVKKSIQGEKRKISVNKEPTIKKRKKVEEKSSESVANFSSDEKLASEGINNKKRERKKYKVSVKKTVKSKDSLEKQKNQKLDLKNKIILDKCRETLEILSKLDFKILESLSKSLSIVINYNLMSGKYMSLGTLLELISLAMQSRTANDGLGQGKELSLMEIARNCLRERRGGKTGEPSPVRDPSATTSNNDVQEMVPHSTSTSANEILGFNETLEPMETSAELAAETLQKNCITKYFKKLDKPAKESEKNERFSNFNPKPGTSLASIVGHEFTGERRLMFEKEFHNQNSDCNYLTENLLKSQLIRESPGKAKSKGVDLSLGKATSDVKSRTRKKEQNKVSLTVGCKAKTDGLFVAKVKLLQFHENKRPPYWGTWRKKSETVGGRRPFGKDTELNYEVDSDEEWEEEEAGESLHGSDCEKEPEDDYEVDNEFFVPHGYLSDDENSDKEKAEVSQKNQKTTPGKKQKLRKLMPVVFGIWKDTARGTLYEDLQIGRLKCVAWTATPIKIVKEKKEIKKVAPKPVSPMTKSKIKIFPSEETCELIKMIHLSPQNSNVLAKKFLEYWDSGKAPDGSPRPSLTKICVQRKMKELAKWQPSQDRGKMCWRVRKEVIKEFGVVFERESPKKKARNSFIWKFLNKADKIPRNAVGNSPVAPATAEPEVVVLKPRKFPRKLQ